MAGRPDRRGGPVAGSLGGLLGGVWMEGRCIPPPPNLTRMISYAGPVNKQMPAGDIEMEALTATMASVRAAGIEVVPETVVNLYVALKSKPLLLLLGPANSGKVAVLRCLAQALTGGDMFRCQFMPGHAWWAGQSGNVALFTNAQLRLNTGKLLALLEEAHAPQNRERLLLACLTRISPAELLTVFSDTAFQIRRGGLMRLCAAHFSEPVPYPTNLLLAGTLDGPLTHGLDSQLLSMTSVVQWSASAVAPDQAALLGSPGRDYGPTFLASMVRTETQARLRLRRVLKRSVAAIRQLDCLEEIFRRHEAGAFPSIRSDLLVYLANAFSRTGSGLFQPGPAANLEAALDWGLHTVVVPRLAGPLLNAQGLRTELQRVCAGRWPNTAQALRTVPGAMPAPSILRAATPLPSLAQTGN
jgi:hypothetical protein